MPELINFGLVRSANLPRCRQANASVRKLSSMPPAGNEAVHVHRLAPGYKPHGHAKLATETKAHLRGPLIVSSSDA